MICRRFGKTGWDVSAVGLGTWNLGNQWGEMTDAEARDIILAAVDSGMNLLDTAESYGIPNGTSEMRIGKTLTPPRAKACSSSARLGTGENERTRNCLRPGRT
jgi:aryl-alcohol dehydrogenase-like predicted oxidoreductase